MVGYIADRYRPGDLILIDYSRTPLVVYGPREGLRDAVARTVWPPPRTCTGRVELTLRRRYRRVWLTWGHDLSGRPANLRDAYRARLATVGAKVDSYHRTGAGTDLYDLTRPPEDPGGTNPLLRTPAGRCLFIPVL